MGRLVLSQKQAKVFFQAEFVFRPAYQLHRPHHAGATGAAPRAGRQRQRKQSTRQAQQQQQQQRTTEGDFSSREFQPTCLTELVNPPSATKDGQRC